MFFIGWMLLGALIGVAAAQKKGFSIAGGVLGGLLLGPLAFLMFAVSGVSGSDRNRKCPACAEFVKADARICKHCKTELPPLSVERAKPSSGVRPPAMRPSGPRPTSRSTTQK